MKKIIEQEEFFVRCPACENSLGFANLILLDKNENRTAMHVTCKKCESAAMVFLTSNQTGVTGIGIATDLDSSEVKMKINNEAINADEIIDLYQFISKKDNDIMQLIKNK